MNVIASNVINCDHIDVELNFIEGLEAIEQSLYELVILPLRRHGLFSYEKHLGPRECVLLYDLPSIWKTMQVIAKESGRVMYSCTSHPS
ncbi:P-loop containing nucleoside triphosphate hydrolases superfamily protein [Artemisia annua]|uniref:P-loop containing nucleoside triphosphate hydrolases superfamily protein n=1 Tax=Artemisia annua TaxID=35608 RepID=A0A2U1NAY8_ARTAN|nr:P-loop containing nucleoside triphosphate hydrolases superfamily protein [Artemisia annua]